MEHTIVNGSVHTGCMQHQRVCTQICVQICLSVLCERGLKIHHGEQLNWNMQGLKKCCVGWRHWLVCPDKLQLKDSTLVNFRLRMSPVWQYFCMFPHGLQQLFVTGRPVFEHEECSLVWARRSRRFFPEMLQTEPRWREGRFHRSATSSSVLLVSNNFPFHWGICILHCCFICIPLEFLSRYACLQMIIGWQCAWTYWRLFSRCARENQQIRTK